MGPVPTGDKVYLPEAVSATKLFFKERSTNPANLTQAWRAGGRKEDMGMDRERLFCCSAYGGHDLEQSHRPTFLATDQRRIKRVKGVRSQASAAAASAGAMVKKKDPALAMEKGCLW